MNDNTSHARNGHSPLAESLMLLKQLREAGVRLVPAAPSQAMLQAGAEAGGTDTNTAARIFLAMLEAEDEVPKVPVAELIVG